ncbi:unnamed protein product [Phytophthora fragariaefolia]|uniref:Unnamed protein product n=1 Tax=Phytophthora fragariaefolia TaxID=1490495 RepID=A0A9W6TV18_9STRA|nr:unnamed protein product [Phytophthora fragariaefolia]
MESPSVGRTASGPHDHKLKRAVFESYPTKRRVIDPSVLNFVDELVEGTHENSQLSPRDHRYEFDRGFGKLSSSSHYFGCFVITRHKIILRDVHILVQRLKQRWCGSGSVEDRLEVFLRRFRASRGNTATVFVDEYATTQTNTLQTKPMHRCFKAFLELVILGSTHETNASRYKIFSFMIDDVFGMSVHNELMISWRQLVIECLVGLYVLRWYNWCSW